VSRISILVLLAVALHGVSLGADTQVSVGVLAIRGEERASAMWAPTMEYLGETVEGHRFEIDPQRLDGLLQGVAEDGFDFVLTNPGQYVELEAVYGITRLATLKNLRRGKPYDVFGAIIFTRTDNPDVTALEDIAGKRFAAVDRKAFGGFHMAWYELLEAGVDPFTDTAELLFTGFPQDLVVYAVRDGLVDAGTVRTDVLERMEAEGLVDADEFRIINPQTRAGFPFRLSTPLYPEWAFARTMGTPEELAKDVALALLAMPAEHPAAQAGRNAGWQAAGNYNPVHELYKAIQYGPYEDYGEFDVQDVVRRYWPLIALAGLGFLFGVGFIAYSARMNRKLSLAKARAETANQAKSTFLANMSHEIRTPLNAVLGYAQILKSAPDIPVKYASQLTSIGNAGNHLLNLISDIIDLSRIESGADALSEEEFSLPRLVGGLVGVFEMRCHERDLRLVEAFHFEGTLQVYGDEGKLRQVLYNLLGNAVKFTERGEVKLTVRQQGDRTFFAVQDTGCGIPESDLVSIFDPFTQTEEGLRRGGAGLGLGISRRFVRLMGGELRVESQEGFGSRFQFELPLRVTGTEYTGDWEGVADERYALPNDVSLYALVVDDVEDNRLVLSQILGGAGVEVATADNGREALESIERRTPDIVWMDIRMPVMGGEEAVQVMRERWGDGIPCVAISASSQAGGKMDVRDSGFDAFIPKPFSVKRLFSLTERLTGVRFERQSSAPRRDETSDSANGVIRPERLEVLRAAADGHRVTTIRKELLRMHEGDASERQLAGRLEPLLSQYDMAGIRDLLSEVAHG